MLTGGQTIACNAPFGKGGLGRHLEQVVEEAKQAGQLDAYFATAVPADDPHGRYIDLGRAEALNRLWPLRQQPAWRHALVNDAFDRQVVSRLTRTDAFVGFSGQALRSFEAARRLGASFLALESPTAHLDHVWRQQARALRDYPIEDGWLGAGQLQKGLQEYRTADRIRVHSPYVRATFLEAGVSADRLDDRQLAAHPRFAPRSGPPASGEFRVVYVGALTVLKGVPVLLEAFSRLRLPEARLVLVGGWTTRKMRQHVQGWLERDRRISVASSDPLEHLQAADVYVHPSYTDGLGLAPLEALQCGVPAIVTEDTGMKHHIVEGQNGHVIPTGSWQALLERLEAMAGR